MNADPADLRLTLGPVAHGGHTVARTEEGRAMNPATKRLAGSPYSSSGVPPCSRRPARRPAAGARTLP